MESKTELVVPDKIINFISYVAFYMADLDDDQLARLREASRNLDKSFMEIYRILFPA